MAYKLIEVKWIFRTYATLNDGFCLFVSSFAYLLVEICEFCGIVDTFQEHIAFLPNHLMPRILTTVFVILFHYCIVILVYESYLVIHQYKLYRVEQFRDPVN
ncbi:hypothetical protein DVK06_13950 [Halorubrum sp. Atlit-28R]|nr:hypothetical protein DVK06_13950 [Halorubrum sp. Atlit-28R]